MLPLINNSLIDKIRNAGGSPRYSMAKAAAVLSFQGFTLGALVALGIWLIMRHVPIPYGYMASICLTMVLRVAVYWSFFLLRKWLSPLIAFALGGSSMSQDKIEDFIRKQDDQHEKALIATAVSVTAISIFLAGKESTYTLLNTMVASSIIGFIAAGTEWLASYRNIYVIWHNRYQGQTQSNQSPIVEEENTGHYRAARRRQKRGK